MADWVNRELTPVDAKKKKAGKPVLMGGSEGGKV